MRTILPFLPLLNLILIPVAGWVLKHEKEHTKLWLLLRQVCVRLKIETGD